MNSPLPKVFSFRYFPAVVALVYAVLATLGIVVTDYLQPSFLADPLTHHYVDIAKSFLLVFVSSVMIYVLLKLFDQVKNSYAALLESEQHLAKAQSLAKIGSWHVVFGENESQDVWSITKTLRDMYGLSDDAPIDTQTYFELILPEDRERIKSCWAAAKRGASLTEWNRRISINGQIKWIHEVVKITLDDHGTPLEANGTNQDITERVAAESRTGFLASHDRLTELPNRELFYDRLSQAISQARRKRGRLAILFLDLDGFKPINDNYGHEAGDILLKTVAQRLQECVRDMDTVARLGGDEFAVTLSEIANPVDANIVAGNIINKISAPIALKGNQECCIGVSIGIAIFPGNGFELDSLLIAADSAMYQSKARGKNTFTVSERHAKLNESIGPWISLDASRMVGVQIIDEQHQTLVNMLNSINLALSEVQPLETIDHLFDELISFTAFHFKTEEQLMDEYGYPDLSAHKKVHLRLLDEVTQLKGGFVEGRELIILQTLKDWLLLHISGFDHSLADHLIKRGVL